MAYNILDQLGNQSVFFPSSPQSAVDKQLDAVNTAMFTGGAEEQARAAQEQAAKLEQARRADEATKAAIAAAVPQTQFSQEAILRANGYLTGRKRIAEDALARGDQATYEQAKKEAEAVRNYFAKQGMTGLFGADEYNANEAGAVLQAQQGMAMQNFLDMASPKEVYIQKQRDYLQQGFNEREAKELAARDADEYQGQWERQALGAAYNYGVGNNRINDNGIRILSGLAAYNPDMAAIGFSSYGTPLDEYRQGLNERNAAMAFGFADQAANRDHAFGLENMLTQGRIGIKAANNAAQNQAFLQDNNTENAIRQMGAQAGFTQAQQDYLVNQYRADPKAFMAVFGGSGSGGNSEPSKAETKAIGDAASLALEFLNGNMAVADYNTKLAKITPLLDDDSKQFLTNDLVYLKNFLNEYELDPQGENTQKYLRAIKGDPDIMEFLQNNGLGEVAELIK